jgi:hypothetical protein
MAARASAFARCSVARSACRWRNRLSLASCLASPSLMLAMISCRMPLVEVTSPLRGFVRNKHSRMSTHR